VPTEENRNKIMMMMVFGCTNADCAKSIGVSVPTLRKHYLQELSQRTVARLQLDAVRRAALFAKVRAGDVSAIGSSPGWTSTPSPSALPADQARRRKRRSARKRPNVALLPASPVSSRRRPRRNSTADAELVNRVP
jgi:hypothetical protein